MENPRGSVAHFKGDHAARFTVCGQGRWKRRRWSLHVGFVGVLLVLLCIPRCVPTVAAAVEPGASLTTFLMGLAPINMRTGDTCLLTVEDRDKFIADFTSSAAAPSLRTLREPDMSEDQHAAHGPAKQQSIDVTDRHEKRAGAVDWRSAQSRCDDGSSECLDATREVTKIKEPLRASDEASVAAAENGQRASSVARSIKQNTVAPNSKIGRKSQHALRKAHWMPGNETVAQRRKLLTTCFDFDMYDSYGDGWQGAKYLFQKTSTSEIVASGSLVTAGQGSQGTDEICLDGGCHTLRVTGDDLFPDEVSFEFEGISGGSPFGPIYLSVTDVGQIATWDDVCPTPAPTTSESPSVSSHPTPTPSLSLAPTTPSPTPAPVETEVSTFTQLQSAISQAAASGAKLIVALLADITIAETLTIDSSHVVIHSRGGAVLRGGGSRQLFRVEIGGRLTATNVTFRGGYSTNTGGAVQNVFGAVEFADCRMTGNSAADDGGAVQNYGGTASFKDCTMTGNYAADEGGAVQNVQGIAGFKDCTMTGNSANFGGSIYNPNQDHRSP